MIRPFTCVTMLLAAGAGLYLYQTKHRGQMRSRAVLPWTSMRPAA